MPELLTRAQRPDTARKQDAPEVYSRGRVCSSRSCSTQLSIYHRGPQCYACEPAPYYIFLDSAEELRELMEEAA